MYVIFIFELMSSSLEWLVTSQTHDKYKFVGHLVDDPINEILEHIEENDEREKVETNKEKSPETSSDDVAA